MRVVDDEKLINLQIVLTLWIAHACLTALKDDIMIPDMAFDFPSLWDEKIDESRLGIFFN
jgi:hypothetical protein